MTAKTAFLPNGTVLRRSAQPRMPHQRSVPSVPSVLFSTCTLSLEFHLFPLGAGICSRETVNTEPRPGVLSIVNQPSQDSRIR